MSLIPGVSISLKRITSIKLTKKFSGGMISVAPGSLSPLPGLGLVYLLRNKNNGKIYVGQTWDFAERWRGHLADTRNGSALYIHCALREAGVKSFEVEFVAQSSSQEKLDELEKFWISKLKTYNPGFGYNLTLGGREKFTQTEDFLKRQRSAIESFWSKLSPEEKKKFSRERNDKWLEWWNSLPLEERKKRNSEVQHARWNQLSSERKQQIIEARRKSRWSPGHQANNRGKIGITDGILNKYISITDPIPEGWRRGLTQRRKEESANERIS